jgi:transmembrane sensor
MSPTDDQIRAAITSRAAEWFAAQRSDSMDEHDQAAFFAWLKSSPLHIEEYLAVAAIEQDLAAATADSALSLEQLRELARSDTSGNVTALPTAVPPTRPADRPRSRALTWGRLAAAAVIAAAIAATAAGIVWGVLDRWGPEPPKTYQTARGAQGVWRLPDGSLLRLNGDSAVRVRLSTGERRVELDHGQAFFDVAHDLTRPFRVISGNTSTVAVGTQFDVSRQPDTLLITVLQGQVAVFDAAPATMATTSLASGSLQVSAGQQLQINSGQLPGAPTAADLSRAEAWLQRQIVFKHQPLGELAAEFSRNNAVAITITDPALNALPVSGVFNAYDIDSFTSFLRSLDHVQVDRLPTGIRVSRTR